MFSDKIYNPAAARRLARVRTDTGLKLVQINHGGLTQEGEEEELARAGVESWRDYIWRHKSD